MDKAVFSCRAKFSKRKYPVNLSCLPKVFLAAHSTRSVTSRWHRKGRVNYVLKCRCKDVVFQNESPSMLRLRTWQMLFRNRRLRIPWRQLSTKCQDIVRIKRRRNKVVKPHKCLRRRGHVKTKNKNELPL